MYTFNSFDPDTYNPLDDEAELEVGDRVSVFQAGAWEARRATVQAVRDDGQVLVHMSFGITKWVWEHEITQLGKGE